MIGFYLKCFDERYNVFINIWCIYFIDIVEEFWYFIVLMFLRIEMYFFLICRYLK